MVRSRSHVHMAYKSKFKQPPVRKKPFLKMKLQNFLTVSACILTAKAANTEDPNENISGCFDSVAGEITLDMARSIIPHSCMVYGSRKKVPVEVIDYVLRNELVDINASDRYGYNSITNALIRGDFEAANALVAQGAYLSGSRGYTPIIQIMRWEGISDAHALKAVDYLLRHGADPHVIDKRGNSALSAASTRSPELVKLFLEMGLNPNHRTTDSFKRTPLHEALSRNPLFRQNTFEVVKLLLAYGADLSLKDCNGDTPLLTALINCYFQIFDYFLATLKNEGRLSLLNEPNQIGLTAINYFQRKGFERECQAVTQIISRYV